MHLLSENNPQPNEIEMVTKAFEVQATSPKQDEKSGNTFFSGGPFFSGTTSWIAISTSAGVRARPVRAEPYHRYNKNDLPSCYSGRKYIIRQREKHFSDKKDHRMNVK